MTFHNINLCLSYQARLFILVLLLNDFRCHPVESDCTLYNTSESLSKHYTIYFEVLLYAIEVQNENNYE